MRNKLLRLIAKVIFDVVVAAGALACILVWLELKPKDIRMMTWPHWLWFIGALILFAISLISSLRSLYLVTRKDSTDWKKAYLEENQQRTHFQQEYATAANRVTELEGKLKERTTDLEPSRFQTPPQETVSNRKFNNETVVMDGKRFYRCTFSNVTFEYHGTASTEILECEMGGLNRLRTDHPAAKTFSKLEHLLTSHHSVQGFTVGSLDAKGNELKPSYSITQIAPYLEILAPLNHAEVGPWRDVRGSVQPPNSKVQVFVYAVDGVWYMQSPVIVDGCSWNVKCKFGLDNVPSGDFQIIAIADGDIKDKTMHTLPNVGTARSDIVKVRRTH
jgi:hypothetical protein